MQLTRDPHAPTGPPHPAAGCVEFPLHLLDEHLTELERRAGSEKRTIGQMIRQAVERHLAGARETGDGHDSVGGFQLDVPPDGSGTIAVTLLLPVAQLAQLEALAARRATPTSALIRRIVCSSLLGRSPDRPPNES
jgi:hypothetical protein